jgi:hypothetical protein
VAPAAAGPKAAAAPKVAVAAAPKAAEELSFDIAYPDDRQETLKLSELVSKYAAGTLGDDAFVWREGMSDWKAPREVPEIDRAISARGISPKPAAAPAPAPAPAAAPAPMRYEEDEATRIQVAPFDALRDDIEGEWREPAKDVPSNPQAPFDLRAAAPLPFEKPEPAPAVVSSLTAKPAAVGKVEIPKPTAARRSEARGGGDLFGDVAAAGSEDDESLGIDAKEAAPKLTGARNESSVLFSLDSLVKQEQKAPPKKSPAKQEDAASILLGSDSGPNSIANVGTGSFGSAFAAPDFSAPITAVPEPLTSAPSDALGGAPAKKGSGLWIGLLAVIVLGGGAAALVLSGKLGGTQAAATGAPSAAPSPVVSPTPSSEPSRPASEPEASAAPSAAPAANGGAAHAAAAAGGTTAASPKPAETAAKPAEATAKPSEATAKPAEAAAKPAETAAKPAPATDSSAPPFDTAAAKTALGAAAANAGSCKTADGPTGSGKVSVTFMPSGRATNTQVSGDLAGTAVGGCVARLFRSAKVPAFSGDPVTVSKSFTVQ